MRAGLLGIGRVQFACMNSHGLALLAKICGGSSATPHASNCTCGSHTAHRSPPPPGIRERIYNFEGVAYAHFEPQAYEGDTRWMENF